MSRVAQAIAESRQQEPTATGFDGILNDVVFGDKTIEGVKIPNSDPDADPEPEPEPEPKNDPEPKPEPTNEFTLPDDYKPILGDDVKSVDDVLSRTKKLFEELTEEKAANDQMAQLLDEDPALRAVLADVMKYRDTNGRAGRPLLEAFRVHANIEGEIPDPSEDPDGYAAAMEKQAERKANAKAQEEARRKQEEIAHAAATHAQSVINDFKGRTKMSDAEFADFQKTLGLYIYGDPKTGQIPKDAFDVFYKALNYEKHLAEARERGRAEGKTEAVNRDRAARKGDGLKHFGGGAGSEQQPAMPKTMEFLGGLVTTKSRIPRGVPLKK